MLSELKARAHLFVPERLQVAKMPERTASSTVCIHVFTYQLLMLYGGCVQIVCLLGRQLAVWLSCSRSFIPAFFILLASRVAEVTS